MSDEDLPTTARQELRTAADSVLARLVGAAAGATRLREDHWHTSRRWSRTSAEPWWCSGRAGGSPRCTSSRPRCRASGARAPSSPSPLLALMRNQVETAARTGIHARTINSSNTEQWDTIRQEVTAGTVDALLVSPEELTFIVGSV